MPTIWDGSWRWWRAELRPRRCSTAMKPNAAPLPKDVLATTRNLTEKAEAYLTLPAEERARLYRHLTLPEADRLKMLRHTEELDLDYRQSPICSDCIADRDQARNVPGAFVRAPRFATRIRWWWMAPG